MPMRSLDVHLDAQFPVGSAFFGIVRSVRVPIGRSVFPLVVCSSGVHYASVSTRSLPALQLPAPHLRPLGVQMDA